MISKSREMILDAPENNPRLFGFDRNGSTLWQLFIIYWIDMYNEYVTDAAKLTEYWFHAFVNPSTKREEKNDEK